MKGAQDIVSDEPDPEQRSRGRARSVPRDSEELVAPAQSPEIFDAAALLPGAVLMVPNRHWAFEVAGVDDHPGACTHYRPGASSATLLKGTDAQNVRYPRTHYFVDASSDSGLKKRTGFQLVPRPFRLHRLKLYFPERYLGRLDEKILQAMRAELARLHPED